MTIKVETVLTLKNKFKNMKEFEYYGLFLTDKCKKTLMNWINDNGYYNPNGKYYLDHCTLLHRSQENEDVLSFCEFWEGAKFVMRITAIGKSNKAMAFKVELNEATCANSNPHITICTFESGKPVDSNKIYDWVEIPVMNVTGILRSVKHSIKRNLM